MMTSKKNVSSCFVAACLLFHVSTIAQPVLKTLRRSESYWGLHFDMQASLKLEHIGKNLTEGMVDSLILFARPDYLQVDTKGHPGISSYPTKVGQQAKSYDKDPLQIIRAVTAKHHVALYSHYSGVIDANYVRLHPSEAAMNADGKPSTKATSFWSNYCDSLMIPQLKELATDYKVDGVWIDGDTWGFEPDYRPAALREFTQKTGITAIPKSPNDKYYNDFFNFHRDKYAQFLAHYTSELHKVAPQFQLCANRAYSDMMPYQIPTATSVDFISADYNNENGLNSIVQANWLTRCYQGQKKPFDLMDWSFVGKQHTTKQIAELCQEAASVISMGGGFQLYFSQNIDISFNRRDFPLIKQVADFMLARKPYCFGVSPIPQIGIFFSTAGWRQKSNSIFGNPVLNDIRGTLNAYLDGQHSAELLMTHQLLSRINEYPLIVVPDWEIIEPSAVAALKNYVNNGGHLIVMGANTTKYFDDLLGVKQSQPAKATLIQLSGKLNDTATASYRQVSCAKETEIIATAIINKVGSVPTATLATMNNYGKGKIMGIYANLGTHYQLYNNISVSNYLTSIMNRIFTNPLVRVDDSSHKLNIVTITKNKKTLIQLVNTSCDYSIENRKAPYVITPLHHINLTIAAKQKPKQVLLQPEGKVLPCIYKNGHISVTIPEILIHYVLEIVNG